MKALNYHLQTVHQPNKFAKGPSFLDWENQPNPYKSYTNTKKIKLNISNPSDKPYEKLYAKNDFEEFNLDSIAKFLEYSLALSAIKEYINARWAVRINPSSGNLHPEESYIVFKNSVYHFNVKEFSLEEIARSDEILINESFIFILTTIPLRESWKYGERALRYCLLDTGHAIAAARFSSNLLGWNMKKINAPLNDLKKLIGLNRAKFHKNENEYIEEAFFIYKDKLKNIDFKKFETLKFNLNYIPLTKDSIKWEIIYETIEDMENSNPTLKYHFSRKKINFTPSPFNAYEIIKNRRSALGFEKAYVSKEDFFDILDKTIRRKIPPFDIEIPIGNIKFLIFVNRVEGISPGIYYFDEKLELIEKGDFSSAAKFISCMQDLGSESAFCLFMISEKNKIKTSADYKYLMIEAGILGHILYLEAEAKNLRGCGIGCFFDELISTDILNNPEIITLYGFSIGKPVIDERIIPINADEGILF